MNLSKRRRVESTHLYCAECCIRVGNGERHLVKDGKIYHGSCYSKLNQNLKPVEAVSEKAR